MRTHFCAQRVRSRPHPNTRLSPAQVPGAFELPYAAERMQASCDVVLCIGCLIKGSTMHFEYISEAVAQGIMRLNQRNDSQEHAEAVWRGWRSPVIYGVLECLTEAQALERAGLVPGSHNHGTEWAQSALRMAAIGMHWEDTMGSGLPTQTVAGFRAQHAQLAPQ